MNYLFQQTLVFVEQPLTLPDLLKKCREGKEMTSYVINYTIATLCYSTNRHGKKIFITQTRFEQKLFYPKSNCVNCDKSEFAAN